MRMKPKKERAFTFVEVMFSILIIAVGLGAIILFYRQVTQVAHFNEYHLLARYRSRRIANHLAALDYRTVKTLAGTVTTPSLSLAGCPKGLEALPNLLPSIDYELPVVADTIPLPNYLEHFRQKMKFYKEAVFWEELSAKGLGRIVVIVNWKLPNESKGAKAHVYKHVHFVSLQEASLLYRPPLKGGP